MADTITLTAADGHTLSAYRAVPAGPATAALVVIQEIFGVNRHMRRVCDGLAREGFFCLSPALFDRVRPGIELGYDAESIASGREIRGKLDLDQALSDVQAAIDAAAGHGKTGVVGYCWGGSLAYLAATRLSGISGAVGYYGGQIAPFAGETPKVPTMLHFGAHDSGIPLTDVDKIKAAQPGLPIHVYDAGHGFNCEERKDYDAASADAALGRTLAFFRQHLG